MAIIQAYEVLAKGVGRKDYSGMVEYSTAPTIRSYQELFHISRSLTIPANYTTGTATFVLGSTQVLGVGTAWIAAMVGQRINNGTESRPQWFIISAVVSPTEITLDETYWLRGAGTTGVPVAYTIGGVSYEYVMPENHVVVLYDFIASRPNNMLLEVIIEYRLRGQSGTSTSRGRLVDKMDYQVVEVHISEGYGFSHEVGTIWFVLFNYDTVEQPVANVFGSGVLMTTEEFYLSLD